jgi:hypothetical protein
MLQAKLNAQERILEQIEAMSFHQKCQTRLDHKSALYLAEKGYKIEKQRKPRGGTDIPSIGRVVQRDVPWVRFFLERPLEFWDEYVPESHYDVWTEHFLFSQTPHFATDKWWIRK